MVQRSLNESYEESAVRAAAPDLLNAKKYKNALIIFRTNVCRIQSELHRITLLLFIEIFADIWV